MNPTPSAAPDMASGVTAYTAASRASLAMVIPMQAADSGASHMPPRTMSGEDCPSMVLPSMIRARMRVRPSPAATTPAAAGAEGGGGVPERGPARHAQGGEGGGPPPGGADPGGGGLPVELGDGV